MCSCFGLCRELKQMVNKLLSKEYPELSVSTSISYVAGLQKKMKLHGLNYDICAHVHFILDTLLHVYKLTELM